LKSRCSTAFQKATKTNTRTSPTFTAAAVDPEQSGLPEEEPFRRRRDYSNHIQESAYELQAWYPFRYSHLNYCAAPD
jgi:hypothetical protein